MTPRMLRLLLSALLAALGAACAKQPPPAKAPVRATLPNGLRVVVVPDPLAPVVTTVINYLVGSDEAPKGYPGTAHALEHMMFRGSPGLSAQQLSYIMAALGGQANADTRQSVTQYFFTVPAKDLELPLRVEALRMRGIASDQRLWDQERGAIEQEVAQDLSDPEYVMYTRLLESLFRGTPYAHDALGTRASFDKTDISLLDAFHRAWYAPNNAVLVIAGDVRPEETLRQVRELFGGIPARSPPARPDYRFEPIRPRTFAFETDLPQSLAVVAFRWPGTASPDYPAARILADALGSRRGELYGLVAEGKALDGGFDYEPLREAGLGYATVAVASEREATAVAARVQGILSGIAESGVPEDLIEAAKRREAAGLEFDKDSVPGLAMAWSEAVAVKGRESPSEVVESLRRVTAADVRLAAKRLLDRRAAVTAILTPRAAGKPAAAKRPSGPESFAPSRAKSVPLPDWARRAVQRLEVPRSTLAPSDARLPNGIRLIVQPESVSDTVAVYGRIKSQPGLEVPPGKEGVDLLLDRLLSFGTRSMGRVAFEKALDDIGARLSPGTDFSLEVPAEHFEEGLRLLADVQLTPALPQEAFDALQPELAAAVGGQLRSPAMQAELALRAALYPKGDPLQRHATPASISALSLIDVAEYRRRVFRPDLTTIVVIGKVTPEKAREAVLSRFGGWRAEGPKPDVVLPPAPPNRPSAMDVPDPSRVQDKVVLAQTLGLTRRDTDYYALELGDRVLSGGFYATRLYRDLRETTGLVYHVGTSLDVGESRGTYSVEYACDPKNVARARAIAVGDLQELRAKDVDEEELLQAKTLLLRQIPLSERSFERIAQGWLDRSMLGLPLDEPVRAGRMYMALGAKDVRSAFSRWLRPRDLAQMTLGPAPPSR